MREGIASLFYVTELRMKSWFAFAARRARRRFTSMKIRTESMGASATMRLRAELEASLSVSRLATTAFSLAVARVSAGRGAGRSGCGSRFALRQMLSNRLSVSSHYLSIGRRTLGLHPLRRRMRRPGVNAGRGGVSRRGARAKRSTEGSVRMAGMLAVPTFVSAGRRVG